MPFNAGYPYAGEIDQRPPDYNMRLAGLLVKERAEKADKSGKANKGDKAPKKDERPPLHPNGRYRAGTGEADPGARLGEIWDGVKRMFSPDAFDSDADRMLGPGGDYDPPMPAQAQAQAAPPQKVPAPRANPFIQPQGTGQLSSVSQPGAPQGGVMNAPNPAPASASGSSGVPQNASQGPQGQPTLASLAQSMMAPKKTSAGAGGGQGGAWYDNPDVQQALLQAGIAMMSNSDKGMGWGAAIGNAAGAGAQGARGSKNARVAAADKAEAQRMAQAKILLDAMGSDRADARSNKRLASEEANRREDRDLRRADISRRSGEAYEKRVADYSKIIASQQDEFVPDDQKLSPREIRARAEIMASSEFGKPRKGEDKKPQPIPTKSGKPDVKAMTPGTDYVLPDGRIGTFDGKGFKLVGGAK